MLLLEYRLIDKSEEQIHNISEFNNYMILNIIKDFLDDDIIKQKIAIRLKDIDKKVNWINWIGRNKTIDIDKFMNTFKSSIYTKKYTGRNI